MCAAPEGSKIRILASWSSHQSRRWNLSAQWPALLVFGNAYRIMNWLGGFDLSAEIQNNQTPASCYLEHSLSMSCCVHYQECGKTAMMWTTNRKKTRALCWTISFATWTQLKDYWWAGGWHTPFCVNWEAQLLELDIEKWWKRIANTRRLLFFLFFLFE